MLTFSRNELEQKGQVEFSEELTLDPGLFQADSRIKSLKTLRISGKGWYEKHWDILAISAKIEGTMVVPCALTLQDVDYPFVGEVKVTYSFGPPRQPEFVEVTGDIVDILPEVIKTVALEIPLRVVAKDAGYSKGENWEVLSEAEYWARKKEEIDPRLAKLAEYRFSEDEEE